MKKLIEKDKKNRKIIKKLEKKNFILKIIQTNSNLPTLTRLNASSCLNIVGKNFSKTLISNRCIATSNKRKFEKSTHYSRIFFSKLAKTQKIYGLYKSSW